MDKNNIPRLSQVIFYVGLNKIDLRGTTATNSLVRRNDP